MKWMRFLVVLVFAEVPLSCGSRKMIDPSGPHSCFHEPLLADGECTEQQRKMEVPEKSHIEVNEEGKEDRAEIKINRAGGGGAATKATNFHGVEEESVVVISLFKPAPNMMGVPEHSSGVVIHPLVVLTCCSCVTYQLYADQAISAWHHNRKHVPVGTIHPADLVFSRINEHFHGSSQGKEIFLHPNCDNHYEVDLALAVLVREIRGINKVVWIHTLENIQIPRAKFMAPQEVLGNCSIPVWNHAQVTEDTLKYAIREPVYFQNWKPCETLTCPTKIRESTPVDGRQDPMRCNNTLIDLPRSCIAWKKSDRFLCDYYPGAPVFCEIGGITGFVGLHLKYAYSCEEFFFSGVMQGLNNSIDWIKSALRYPMRSLYPKKIPDWMTNLRKNTVRTTKPTGSPHEVKYSSFTGHQLRSIVNVYKNTQFLCRGTLVTRLIVIVPCSCVSHTQYQATNVKQDPHRYSVSKYLAKRLSVILMIYESVEPRTRIEAAHSHVDQKCDSLYDMDYAYLELSADVPNSKVAWLMTANPRIMMKLTRALAVADGSMGSDCFIYDRNETGSQSPSKPVYTKYKVRFGHWDGCMDNVCSSWKIHELIEDRCYGKEYLDAIELDVSTRFCVQSEEPKKDICNMPSGTPVFCNVEVARGF